MEERDKNEVAYLEKKTPSLYPLTISNRWLSKKGGSTAAPSGSTA
jgi:hypothetical protein